MSRACGYLLGLVLLFVGCDKSNQLLPIVPQVMDAQKIGVLDGSASEFDILLKDGRRIKGILKVKTPQESHDEVVILLNNAFAPKIILYEKIGDSWLVDIKMRAKFKDGGKYTTQDITLAKWLCDRKLAWE